MSWFSISLQPVGEQPIIAQAAGKLVEELVLALLGFLEQVGKHVLLLSGLDSDIAFWRAWITPCTLLICLWIRWASASEKTDASG